MNANIMTVKALFSSSSLDCKDHFKNTDLVCYKNTKPTSDHIEIESAFILETF